MSQKINTNLFPKNSGYSFRDSDGTIIAGQSWPDVIGRLKWYRKHVGRPEGGAEEEVMAFACQQNPGLCSNEDDRYKQAVEKASLKERILRWLAFVLSVQAKGELGFVGDDERRQRADICATCPRNEALPSGCQSCNAALKELEGKIIGGRFHDARMHGCGVLGEYLPVVTNLQVVAVYNAALPGHCWRKIKE